MTSDRVQYGLPHIPEPPPSRLRRRTSVPTRARTDRGEDRISEIPWLGLVTDHRRLFDALQDGWLRPLEQPAGILVGIGRYAPERNTTSASHPILVRMRLNVEKLPALAVNVYREGRWTPSPLDALGSSDEALYWPGVLPTFAISDLLVSTEEERARLTGMARRVSNVELPEDVVRVDVESGKTIEPDVPLPETEVLPRLWVSSREDAIHGAMSMAVWAVPRIEPWLDLLTESLAADRTRLPDLAGKVEAGWWRFPPWVQRSDDPQPIDLNDCLWLASLDVFRHRTVEDRVGPRELAERIATAAYRLGHTAEFDGEISAWLRATCRVLRAETVVRLDEWRSCPVGIAIQLVLTRQEPTAFKTWFKDRPDLPPAIGWSAATLSGLLHGYRRLDTQFRGKAFQREILSIHALRTYANDMQEIGWPSCTAKAPRWHKDADAFVLSWGDKEFARKPIKERGRWFAADFKDTRIVHDARLISDESGWPCSYRELGLRDVKVPVSGSGNVHVVTDPSPRIDVEGEVRIRLPKGVDIEEKFDIESFRHLIATEAGRFPDPPVPQAHPIHDVRIEQPGVPGLTYMRNFLSEREEEAIVAEIDRCDWHSDLKRRVQHYGWRYDYKARQIDPSMHLGPLPGWADDVARRLFSDGHLPQLPDQVIVNEYRENQGISRHVDSRSFADGIATISLLESWEMVFREKGTKRKIGQILDRRSVAVMKGDARYRWTHEIPQRKFETRKNNRSARVTRGRRISLTFRKVIVLDERGRESG